MLLLIIGPVKNAKTHTPCGNMGYDSGQGSFLENQFGSVSSERVDIHLDESLAEDVEKALSCSEVAESIDGCSDTESGEGIQDILLVDESLGVVTRSWRGIGHGGSFQR